MGRAMSVMSYIKGGRYLASTDIHETQPDLQSFKRVLVYFIFASSSASGASRMGHCSFNSSHRETIAKYTSGTKRCPRVPERNTDVDMFVPAGRFIDNYEDVSLDEMVTYLLSKWSEE